MGIFKKYLSIILLTGIVLFGCQSEVEKTRIVEKKAAAVISEQRNYGTQGRPNFKSLGLVKVGENKYEGVLTLTSVVYNRYPTGLYEHTHKVEVLYDGNTLTYNLQLFPSTMTHVWDGD